MEQCLQKHQKQLLQRLEGIEEEGGPAEKWPPTAVRLPETPTETMEFLARSWSLSAAEISKALQVHSSKGVPATADVKGEQRLAPLIDGGRHEHASKEYETASLVKESSRDMTCYCAWQRAYWSIVAAQASEACSAMSPSISPTTNRDVKLLRAAAGRGGKTMATWIKEKKERKRAEARSRNAQAYAATSVAGVAAAVATLVAGAVFSAPPERPKNGLAAEAAGTKTAAAIASAAALVASHCVEMAQSIGASHDQILAAIHSAVNAQTSGDIMALTAGAATALRGAAMLRATLHKEIQAAALAGESRELEKDTSPFVFVSKGGELLKRTRQGILHWKLVNVYMNSRLEVIIKMRSAHMAGTFIKTKKFVVLDICSEIPAWAGREIDDGSHRRCYFGIKAVERVIEFECRNKNEQHKWVQGITEMLNHRDSVKN